MVQHRGVSGKIWDELADIATHHNKLAHTMTSSQIAEAQKLAREWKPKTERQFSR